MNDGKKRRKKKLKKSISLANETLGDTESIGSVSTTNDLNVPDDILKIKQEQKHPSDGPSSTECATELSPQQTVPINLTNEHGKMKTETNLHGYSTNLAEPMQIPDYANTVCKIGELLITMEDQSIDDTN